MNVKPNKPVQVFNLNKFYKIHLIKSLPRCIQSLWSKEWYLITMFFLPIIIPTLPIIFLLWLIVECKKIICVKL